MSIDNATQFSNFLATVSSEDRAATSVLAEAISTFSTVIRYVAMLGSEQSMSVMVIVEMADNSMAITVGTIGSGSNKVYHGRNLLTTMDALQDLRRECKLRESDPGVFHHILPIEQAVDALRMAAGH